jgi:hypothetical protein
VEKQACIDAKTDEELKAALKVIKPTGGAYDKIFNSSATFTDVFEKGYKYTMQGAGTTPITCVIEN